MRRRPSKLRRIHKAIALCLLICLLSTIASSSAASASTPATVTAPAPATFGSDHRRDGEIAAASASSELSSSPPRIHNDDDATTYVKKQLSERLDRVLSGKRQRDVAKWIMTMQQQRQRQRRPTTNGPSQNDDAAIEVNVLLSSIPTESSLSINKQQRSSRRRDPFPTNRFNLELVLMEPEEAKDVPTNNCGQRCDDENVAMNSTGAATEPANSTTGAIAASQLPSSSLFPPLLSALSTRLSTRTSNLLSTAAWGMRLGARAVQLGWNFGPVGATVGWAYLSRSFRNHYWYKWLAHSMGKSGPAFIKWGQWSSTRPDLFPEPFCDALSTLHSNAPAHSWSHSESMLIEALRLPTTSTASTSNVLSIVFDDIDPEPLASGSIAQVYKAVLDGRLVAIKIRHPNVEQLMEMDFTLMNTAAALLDRALPILRWLHIRETLDQFSTSLKAQADLRVEAIHLERLNHNFRNWPHVRFPHPILATSTVIIETFEPGRIVTTVLDMYEDLADAINREESLAHRASIDTHISLTTPSNDRGAVAPSYALVASGGSRKGDDVEHGPIGNSLRGLDSNLYSSKNLEGHHLIPIAMAKFIVTTGLGVYLKMLLVDNLMHADLHPGNIMVHFHRHYHRHMSPRKKRRQHSDVNDSMLAMVPLGDARATAMGHQHQRLDRLLGICLVDAGMVAELTDQESSTFIGLLSSLGEGDGASAADFALGFSLENNLSDDARADFRRDMVELFAERCRGYGTDVDVGHVLRGILGLVRKHRVRIDANFATLVVNCLCIESLARAVCPRYNVLDAAKPLLRSYRQLVYGKDSGSLPHDHQDAAAKHAKRRSRWWVKVWLSLMYVRKNVLDRRFFRREERLNKGRTRAQRLLLEIPG